jgi:hypothetical protein
MFPFEDFRYLGKMIGELDRHNASRWSKFRDGIQFLVEYLEMDVDDLELQRTTTDLVFSPKSFPHFPPLSLVSEDIWTIAEAMKVTDEGPIDERYRTKPTLDFWLKPGAIGVGPRQTQWLYIPDEIEFDLLSRWMLAVSRHRVLFKKTIKNALTDSLEYIHHGRALVLVISGDESAEDLNLLMRHRQGAPLLIMSLHEPPLLDSLPRPLLGRKRNTMRLEFESWRWVLSPNWRQNLLQWTESHFQKKEKLENHFSSGGVQKVLRKFDPAGQWFTSVDDVLTLAQAVSELGEHELDKSLVGDTDASELMKRLSSHGESKLALFDQLVQARWLSWHLPWEDALTGEKLASLAQGLCKLDLLVTQFFRRTATGYVFKRPIVARLLLRSYLMRQLSLGNICTWVPACFDDQRRPLLDAALDALSASEFKRVVVRFNPQLAHASHLGAAEALFAAAGRRMIRAESIDASLLDMLAIVIPRLRNKENILLPYSRPMSNAAARIEWVSICWAWSLETRCPDLREPSWQFPGWHETLPREIPDFLRDYGASHSVFSWEREPMLMGTFLGMVRRWLFILKKAPNCEGMPPVFISALLIEAAIKSHPPDPGWWQAIIGNPGAEHALIETIACGNASNRETALRWWPSLVADRHAKAERAQSFARIGDELFTPYPDDYHYSPLMAWIMEQLENHAAPALALLERADLDFLMTHPSLLSASFKRELLKLIPGMPEIQVFPLSIPHFLNAFGTETREEMCLLLDHPLLGTGAANCLWRWTALEEHFSFGDNLSPLAIKNLLQASPAAALDWSLPTFKKHAELHSVSERIDWAERRLPNARHHAQELLKLIAA